MPKFNIKAYPKGTRCFGPCFFYLGTAWLLELRFWWFYIGLGSSFRKVKWMHEA